MGCAAKFITLEGPLNMRNGGILPVVTLAYETWGALNPAKDNVLLLFTGLSPKAHARSSPADRTPGWWEEMIGPGSPIDTNRFHVICFNNLGSCFGSTGPATIQPSTGERYRLDFPVLSIEDIACGARMALAQMGITQLSAVMGCSLGGMSALAYAVLYPDEVAALGVISAAPCALPFAIAIHSLQREAMRDDPAWRDGDYAPDAPPARGMRLARKIGMLSYRSAAEFQRRFGRERTAQWGDSPFGIEFEVESYLESHARKFVHAFDANCYLYLSRAMDLFDVAEHGGSLVAGLAHIEASKVLIIGVETDILFPISQQREMAGILRGMGAEVTLAELPSLQGHDAFLVDRERFGPVICNFLESVIRST